MSNAAHEAALLALREAEEALAAAEKAEVGISADEPVAVAPAVPAERAKYLDMGPTYLGPTAINGT